MVAGGIEINLRFLFASLVDALGGEQGTADAGGVGAMDRGELAIARGKGEAVGLTHCGVADDFSLGIEVAHHATNQGKLLKIFFAEDGEVGLKDVQEF